jgi:serine/threonine protein kinase
LGPVFRAHDPERDRPVAIKFFTLDLPPERVHRLVAEFERLIAAWLDHPVLCAPIATGIADASAYLVHDFVDAKSLDLAVRDYGPAPAAHAVRVTAQLAGALDFAAAANVTHGALHPRDVLLSAFDTRLTGIGIASALASVGVAVPIRRPYTAPECVETGKWDRRADVFGLAALMHELLWVRRITGVGREVANSLSGVDNADLEALRATFARALAQDPADRFPTALEFAEALSEAFPGTADPEATIVSMPADAVQTVVDSPAAPESTDAARPDASAAVTADAESGSGAPAPMAARRPSRGRATPTEPSLPLHDLASSVGAEATFVGASRDALADSFLGRDDSEAAPSIADADAGFDTEATLLDTDATLLDLRPHRHRQRPAAPPKEPPTNEPADIDLKTAEDNRFRDVETAPSIVEPTPTVIADPPVAIPARKPEPEIRLSEPEIRKPEPEIPSSQPEIRSPQPATVRPPSEARRRSLFWPVAAALALGAGLGFFGGYGVGSSGRPEERPGGAIASSAKGPGPAPSAVPGREFTESAVGDARKDTAAAPRRAPAAPGGAGDKESGDASQSSTPGRLLVRSTPAGARVSVDGREYGATPVAVRELANGAHRVRITQDGYTPVEQRVVITAARPAQSITVPLERAAPAPRATAASAPPPDTLDVIGRFVGTLVVDSRPTGAKVYVDGKLVGTTPFSMRDVRAGEHAVRLERDGYRRWSSSVRVVASEQNRVTASLER